MSVKLVSKRELARDLRTMVLAAVVAALVVATPSVAAKVANADKVDGKHAVGAGAGKSARSGKLVATNKKGFLPNNIIKKAKNADKLDGLDSTALVRQVDRRGQIQTGAFGAWGGGAGSYVQDVQRFPSRLPVAIPQARTTVVGSGGVPPTANCPGAGEVTVNGWLCVYVVGNGAVSSPFVYNPEAGNYGTSVTGFGIYGSCAAADCWYYGSYAVRAGSAADIGPRPQHRGPSVP